jgi:predicted transcriptional regulator
MGEKGKEIIHSIIEALKEGPRTITQIAEETDINWRTAESNLEILKEIGKVFERQEGKSRYFFLKDDSNYFNLYVKKEDAKRISTIYALISKFCKKLFKHEPTKTQAYKIIWKINNKLNLNLPIGWYQYGPLCVQEYTGQEKQEYEMNQHTIAIIKETTKRYGDIENHKLQDMIYKEEEKQLYIAKERLTKGNFKTKEEINPILIDLIKYAPKEASDVVTDFARATLMLGWDNTKDIFIREVWKYIAIILFRESLEFYYGQNIRYYLSSKIKDRKREAQLAITHLVRTRETQAR